MDILPQNGWENKSSAHGAFWGQLSGHELQVSDLGRTGGRFGDEGSQEGNVELLPSSSRRDVSDWDPSDDRGGEGQSEQPEAHSFRQLVDGEVEWGYVQQDVQCHGWGSAEHSQHPAHHIVVDGF